MASTNDVSSKSENNELDSFPRSLKVSTQVNVSININSLTTAIQALGHHRSKFSHWKLKHPESMEEFDTAAVNIHQIEQFLTKLDGDHTGLLLEVKVLQNSLTDLKNKYSNLEDLLVRETAKREQLEQEFQELKTTSAADKLAAQHESDKQKSIIRAFDLIRMYRHYYAESIVGGNWGTFCEKFYEFEEDVFQKKRTQTEFDAYLKPFDDKLVSGLTFAQIMKLTDERHGIAHTDIRSAAKQQAFLKECSEVDFADYQSKLIASKILPQLRTVSLRRMN